MFTLLDNTVCIEDPSDHNQSFKLYFQEIVLKNCNYITYGTRVKMLSGFVVTRLKHITNQNAYINKNSGKVNKSC